MPEYPKDEFDELQPSERRGAHRQTKGPTSQAGAIALVAVLALAAVLLVVGAVNIIQRSSSDPADVTAEEQARASEEPAAEPTDSETEVAVVDKTAEVSVLNASGISGAADEYASALESADWTIAEVGNYSTPDSETIVYYADPEFQVQAEVLAEEIGAAGVEESADFEGDLTIVLCSDIAEQIPGEGSDEETAEGSDEESADATDGETSSTEESA